MPEIEIDGAALSRLTDRVEHDGKFWDWSSVEISDDRHRVTLSVPRDRSDFDWPADEQNATQ